VSAFDSGDKVVEYIATMRSDPRTVGTDCNHPCPIPIAAARRRRWTKAKEQSAPKAKHFSAEARKRMSLAQRKHFAVQRKEPAING
jgi:hypothetical protein